MIGSDGPESITVGIFSSIITILVATRIQTTMNTTIVMMMIILTCGNEDPPGERLHPVADGSHCYRVVPSRLKLVVIVMIMLKP